MTTDEFRVLLFVLLYAEYWKPIPGFPAYDISNWATLRSYWKNRGRAGRVIGDTPKVVKPSIDPASGQNTYTLTCGPGTKPTTFSAQRLVLMAFNRMPEAGEEARHIFDPSKTNLYRWNLDFGTKSQNHIDRIYHGESTCTILSAEDVIQIRAELRSGVKRRSLARRYGVTPENIRAIEIRRIWSHIPDEGHS